MVSSRCFAGGRQFNCGRLKSSCRGHQMAGSERQAKPALMGERRRKTAIARGNADGHSLAHGEKGEPHHEE